MLYYTCKENKNTDSNRRTKIMMWAEFEEIAGYRVSYKDYSEIIEPMYVATNLSKQDFVKVINRKAFEIKKQESVKPVFVGNGKMTPNGCYYTGEWMMQIGEPEADISTGKVTIRLRDMTDAEWQKHNTVDRWLSYYVDYSMYDERLVFSK